MGNPCGQLNSQRASLKVPEAFNFHGLAVNLKANYKSEAQFW